MRWVGTYKTRGRCSLKILVENLMEKDHLRAKGIDGYQNSGD
jgi:hypothetical protein